MFTMPKLEEKLWFIETINCFLVLANKANHISRKDIKTLDEKIMKSQKLENLIFVENCSSDAEEDF